MTDDEVETIAEEEDETREDLEANTPPAETKPKPVDCSKHQRQFLHVPTEKIRRTFAAVTQNAASVVCGPKANQTLKSPNPALNICRRKEAVATDSLFADVPAVDTPGYAGAQTFVGRSSLLTDCCGFCSVSEFPTDNTLLDNIRERGAMDTLTSDHANCEMSARLNDILRALMIGHWKSKPHCQHQNFAEHRWGHVKSNLEWLVSFLDVDPDCWLLALNCACSVMNLTAEKILSWCAPQEVATGETPDISILLHFMFWDIACCARHANKQSGSQKGQEIRGCFVGFAWDVGHKLTFLVLADDSRKVIKRSVPRLANCPENKTRLDENNLRLDKAAGKELRSKANFTTAGRDPCLADGFIVKTLVPDEDKLNDVSPPEGDDDSVDTEIGAPDSIEKVPDLPENYDEELLNPTAEEDPSELLKGKQGRRKKKDAFQGNHRSDQSSIPVRKSSRLQRDANMWEALDPTKSKLNQEIDRRVRSRSSKQKKEQVERPTLESKVYKTYKSAMANPLLRDQRARKWTAQDQDNLADHLKHRKPGEENPLDEPLKFGKRALQTLNPTEDNLKPEEMIGQTFLMPPTADGSCHRAKIMESVRDMKDKAHQDPAHIKFKCLVNNDFEEVVACNDLVDFTEKDTAWEGVWTFEKILSHEKARKGNKDY